MDLHVVGPAAAPEERAAIDAFLDPRIGAPRGSWDGGERSAVDGHIARGGHAARSRRDLLLPVLEATQERFGWISRGALNHVCRRLSVPPAEAYGVATFYALLSTTPQPPVVAHICDDIACQLLGAEDVCAGLARTIGPDGEAARDGRVGGKRSPCLGLCERGPAALLTVAGTLPRAQAAAPVDAVGIVARLESAAADREPGPEPVDDVRPSIPQLEDAGLRLLARVGRVDPTSIDAYRASGGYTGLTEAI